MLRLEKSELIGTPEPLKGGADRARSAGALKPGGWSSFGPYLRVRRGDGDAAIDFGCRDYEARIEEAAGLARAIDLTVAEAVIAPISQIRPATYLGKGKGRGDHGSHHRGTISSWW